MGQYNWQYTLDQAVDEAVNNPFFDKSGPIDPPTLPEFVEEAARRFQNSEKDRDDV